MKLLLLKFPKGFIPSVANTSLKFLDSFPNSGNSLLLKFPKGFIPSIANTSLKFLDSFPNS